MGAMLPWGFFLRYLLDFFLMMLYLRKFLYLYQNFAKDNELYKKTYTRTWPWI